MNEKVKSNQGYMLHDLKDWYTIDMHHTKVIAFFEQYW